MIIIIFLDQLQYIASLKSFSVEYVRPFKHQSSRKSIVQTIYRRNSTQNEGAMYICVHPQQTERTVCMKCLRPLELFFYVIILLETSAFVRAQQNGKVITNGNLENGSLQVQCRFWLTDKCCAYNAESGTHRIWTPILACSWSWSEVQNMTREVKRTLWTIVYEEKWKTFFSQNSIHWKKQFLL